MYSDFVLMVLILDCQAETVNPTQVVIQFDQNTNASINQQDISVIGHIELHSYLNWIKTNFSFPKNLVSISGYEASSISNQIIIFQEIELRSDSNFWLGVSFLFSNMLHFIFLQQNTGLLLVTPIKPTKHVYFCVIGCC